MPHVFTLAQSNSTTIRNRKDPETEKSTTEILWKIEWKFEDIDQTLSDTCISENKTITELLERFFDNTWKLGPTRHLFMKSGIESSADLPVYLLNATRAEIPMNCAIPLREALSGQTLLEYPVFRIRKTIIPEDQPLLVSDQ